MATVEIGANSYETYADVDQADEYLEADFNATAWRDATDDQKARALVTATRILDRMTWLGEKAESDQPLTWPRINTNLDEVEDDEVPAAIVNASIELAAQLVNGVDAANANTANNVRSQSAGSVSIEYFRSFDDPSRLPLPVHEMILRYLGGGVVGTYGGAIASGTDGCGFYDDDYRVGQAY